jgi:ribosomal protein L21E
MMNEQIREYQKSDSEIVQNFINPDIAKEKRDNYYKGQITNITETPADWTTYEVTINPEDK